MPPLRIHTCIVCEQARPEVLGKWTLLGFFGVAPNVRIAIGNFKNPVTLCFVFMGDAFAGKLHVAIRVVTRSGANLPGTSEAEGEFLPNTIASAFFMQFQGEVPGPDRYTVVLALNGEDSYETTFELSPLT